VTKPTTAVTVAAAASAGTGANAQAHAPAGKTRSATDGRDDAKTGKPAPTDASPSQPEPAKAAAPRVAAARGDAAGAQPDLARGNGGGKEPAGPRRGEQQAATSKVSVIAQQAVPAPAPMQLGANASAVVAAIAGEHGLRAAGAGPLESALAFRDAQPMRALKLEMHPAELGTVTVNMRAVGEQMSVELQVENRDAYEQLSADSDAIVKSLRSLGYEIDRISVQQPQAATATAARADQNAPASGFSRDASSFQPGNSGSGSERSGGQNNGQGSRNDAQRHGEPREIGQDRAGGSLYI
jgi:chemotaxis protein MotD